MSVFFVHLDPYGKEILLLNLNSGPKPCKKTVRPKTFQADPNEGKPQTVAVWQACHPKKETQPPLGLKVEGFRVQGIGPP